MDTVEDIIVSLLTEGPLVSRYGGARPVPADDLGPRVAAQVHEGGRAVVVRSFAVDDDTWPAIAAGLERLAGVQHKKVAALLEHGRAGDRGFTVHDDPAGPSLAEWLAERGTVSLAEAVPIVSQVLMGVGDAHLRGLAIGGVEPSRITLHEEEGRALIVVLHAFGLPALLRPAAPVEGGDFAAPTSDPRGHLASDVFSVGALLLRMLTGPWSSALGEDRAAVLRARVAATRGVELSTTLADLLDRILDPDPDKRPVDANALVEELIDAVPMAAFRLPRVEERISVASARVEVGPHSNTSTTGSAMMVFTGRWKDVARKRVHGKGGTKEASPVGGSVSQEILRSAATLTPMPAVPPARARRSAASLWVAGGLLVMMGGGLAVALRSDPGASVPAAAVPVAARVEAKPAVVAGDPGRVERAAERAAERVVDRAIVPADARPEPSMVEFGAVEISTPAVGQLFVDGQAHAATPFVGALPAGPHTLRVEIEGHPPWTADVEIRAGGQHRFASEPASPSRASNERPGTRSRRRRPRGGGRGDSAEASGSSPSASVPSVPSSVAPSSAPSSTSSSSERSTLLGRARRDEPASTSPVSGALLPRSRR